jgi:hypothetical protein
MGLGCARCHDHKFDPILQKDYYRFQAFLAPILWRDDVPAASAVEIADYERRLAAWEAKTADVRREMDEIERPFREAAEAVALKKFPVEMHAMFDKPDGERTPLERQLVALALLQTVGEEAKVDYTKKLKGETKERWSGLKKQLTELEKEKLTPIPVTPSVTDVGPVAPVVFIPGKREAEPIEPGPLSVLDPNPLPISPPLSSQTTGRRTSLANWITSPTNPLTSRVLANRLWQYHFGRGLAESPSDFGRLGQPPSHPELLDWLAVEFKESGWDVKHIFELIVTSSTYRQSAEITPDKLEKDPQNRFLSRGPRFRMDAEMVRDYALAASGLLVEKIGGPSVKPYQPDGVWEAVAMPESDTGKYKRDTGAALYRRSLYTFWKRAAPPATMDIFNAPSREVCAVRRERTDTPLQALATLNDPQFVEAARHLAELALGGGRRPEDALDVMAERLLARPLDSKERAIVKGSLKQMEDFYQRQPDAAKEFLAAGESKPSNAIPAPHLAAMTMVANQLMNLDEVLNK